jgi:hypothetical protein
MPNQKQINLLRRGVDAWNKTFAQPFAPPIDMIEANLPRVYLERAHLIRADFMAANLHGAIMNGAMLLQANMIGTDLSGAFLRDANLEDVNFQGADLTGADLSNSDLNGASFWEANLSGANLKGANLTGAYLVDTNLTGADLSGAALIDAHLVGSDLRGANITGCRIHGVSAWGLQLEGAIQSNLIITREEDEPSITLDNLEVAQFVYLLINNANVRSVIDSISSKVVLILGRFTPERKAILDKLRENLRTHNYSPILFDFDKPASRDLTATISTLAHMARFIIADLTDPSSIPYELATIVPTTPVPVQPILLSGNKEFSMFSDLAKRYSWVLPTFYYKDVDRLLTDMEEKVIGPAESKARELRKTLGG